MKIFCGVLILWILIISFKNVKFLIKCKRKSQARKNILNVYEKLCNQESEDIDRAVNTLKNAKNIDLKEKYKKYIDKE